MQEFCKCRSPLTQCPGCKRFVCTEIDSEESPETTKRHDRWHDPECAEMEEDFSGDEDENEEAEEKDRSHLKKSRDEFEAEVKETSQSKRVKKPTQFFKPQPSRSKTTQKRRKAAQKVKEVKEKHGESNNNNSRKGEEDCEDEKKEKVKRTPQEPFGETTSQVEFLKKFAVPPTECVCHKHETEESEVKTDNELDDWSEILFDSQEAAEEQVRILLQEQKRKNESKSEKSQQCDAFTILKKGGKFMILKTNSCHSQKTDTLDTESKFLRPKIEPELPGQLVGGVRLYVIKSCPACDKLEFDNTLVITKAEDLEALRDNATLQSFCGSRIGGVIPQIKTIAKSYDYQCRILLVTQIQPNENPRTVQEGWSLHHSEMESYFFAKRHGWEIVKIYIDRDCCRVCGATLGKTASGVHGVIEIYDT
jgi:hypothetical protein